MRAARVVDDAGEVIAAASALEPDDARAIIGVTITSATSADETVEVVFLGEIEDATFNFVPRRNVFVGPSGELTQTFDPSWRFVRVMGLATAPNKLMVALRPPTFLSQ